jgi:signal transduction histidine kinase
MQLKILIIDHSTEDRTLIGRYLRKHGYVLKIFEAHNAAEALSLLQENKTQFDCIFLDYTLPDTDGISFLRQIYDKDADLTPFPVVMMKQQGSESVAIDAIRYGAQDYLIKNTISTDTLYIAIAKVRQVFDLKKAQHNSKRLLEHSQKMDAVGQLAGGIAHDFNNLLTITFGNVRLLLDMLGRQDLDKEACVKRVETIQRATERGAQLVKHLMVFSRQRSLDPVIVNINDCLNGLLELLQRSLGDFVEIKTEFAPDIALINIDTGQLEHAIINMSVNARDAMINADGGTFTLSTRNLIMDEEHAQAIGLNKAGTYVELCVADSGAGISADVIDKIFDPFFSTKDIGKGTGLGLSMVYGFVKESGGAIHVKSVYGEGTQFLIYFPQSLSQALVHNNAEQPYSDDILRGHETILLVEDESDIRALTSDTIRQWGYTVLEAANGAEALELIQSTNQKIDLIFTDIAMPGGMNGVQMAARAQTLLPNVKLLFTTGYAAGTVPDMHFTERYLLINKPYRPFELMRILRKALSD